MADIFDVVADATRREILQVLHDCGSAGAAGEISVSQIVGRLELSQPTVSKHLRVLREAGLVRVREKGQHRYYSLDTAPLEAVEDWLLPLLDVAGIAKPGGERHGDMLGGEAREFAGAVGKVIADTSYRVSSAVEKVTARKWRRE
jgi:ArsR family transcriptional regulator, arsenate/arsenite/antimonite-responsive transcriptional repressor